MFKKSGEGREEILGSVVLDPQIIVSSGSLQNIAGFIGKFWIWVVWRFGCRRKVRQTNELLLHRLNGTPLISSKRECQKVIKSLNSLIFIQKMWSDTTISTQYDDVDQVLLADVAPSAVTYDSVHKWHKVFRASLWWFKHGQFPCMDLGICHRKAPHKTGNTSIKSGWWAQAEVPSFCRTFKMHLQYLLLLGVRSFSCHF